jgi:hypothetical protein
MNAKVLVVAFCAFQVRTALSCSARLFALKPNYFSHSINGMFTFGARCNAVVKAVGY